jgi:hypothetical protein
MRGILAVLDITRSAWLQHFRLLLDAVVAVAVVSLVTRNRSTVSQHRHFTAALLTPPMPHDAHTVNTALSLTFFMFVCDLRRGMADATLAPRAVGRAPTNMRNVHRRVCRVRAMRCPVVKDEWCPFNAA